MTRHANGERIDGAGPWRLDVPTLDPGGFAVFNLERHDKGRLRRYLPMDQVMIKNRSDESDLLLTTNGQFEALVEPNAADLFDDAGVQEVRVTNLGSTAVDGNDVVLQVSVEPFGADDAAREQRAAPVLERLGRGLLGL